MFRYLWMSLGLMVLLAGCPRTQAPTLCVFSASELAAAGGTAADFECVGLDSESESADHLASGPPSLGEGEAYYVKWTLPDEVAPFGSLRVHVETPCLEEDVEANPVDGVVLLPRVAPRGASCAFVLTASMANSELAVQVPAADAKACEDITKLCAAAAE